jgi:hypothetical protein
LWCFPIKGTQQHYPIDGNILRLWGDAIKAGETTVLNPPLEVWAYINKWLGLNKRGRKNLADLEANTTSNDTANGVQQHVSIINQFTDPYRLESGMKKSAKRTPSPQRLTLFSSPIPPLERLADYIRWHISRSPAEEADFKAAERVLVEKGFDLTEIQQITSEE